MYQFDTTEMHSFVEMKHFHWNTLGDMLCLWLLANGGSIGDSEEMFVGQQWEDKCGNSEKINEETMKR